jgi:hypothetical protein
MKAERSNSDGEDLSQEESSSVNVPKTEALDESAVDETLLLASCELSAELQEEIFGLNVENSSSSSSCCNDVPLEEVPFATAEPTDDFGRFGSASFEPTVLTAYTRPEFIYCRVIKPTARTPVGLSFQTRRMKNPRGKYCTMVSAIADDGLFADQSSHYVRPGDFVVAVNQTSTDGMRSAEVANLIRQSVGTVSLTVRNVGGDPHTVASSSQKPPSDDKVGLSLKNNATGTILSVTRVEPWGIFSESLLLPGHRVLSVNGLPAENMLASVAADSIRDPNCKIVSIVSRARAFRELYGVVIGCEDVPVEKKHIKSVLKRVVKKAISAIAKPRSNDTAYAPTPIVESN